MSLLVNLQEAYPGTTLVVREFDARLAFRGEQLWYPDGEPKTISERRFVPDMNRARQHGWTEHHANSGLQPTEVLADWIVGRFVDLAAKAERGQLERSSPLRRSARRSAPPM